MAKKKPAAKKPAKALANVSDYRHGSQRRKNNPPAKIAAEGHVPLVPKAVYYYSPRRPPSLRFDVEGQPDQLPELLAAATERPLTPDEARQLADALRTQEPWLEWAGKLEQERRGCFTVDPVVLHIHERISTQAILQVAARQDVERSLFADPEMEYKEAVRFYEHDIDWTNRLILGDSLHVMSSLERRENLAGKVQMIYLDPPYGIKFASNFQPEIGKRDVKDKETDLTREPEMVKAYRDTWTLGVHSYLSYLRDRLIVAKGLLADSGSIFVQIGDENLHRVRMLLDEVFGPQNHVSVITLEKTSGSTQTYLSTVTDYLLWYAKDNSQLKFHEPYLTKVAKGAGGSSYNFRKRIDGRTASINEREMQGDEIYALDNLTSQSLGRDKGEGAACWFPVQVGGNEYRPSMSARWKTNEEGMRKLLLAERVEGTGNRAGYVRLLSDFPVFPVTNLWDDVGSSFMADKVYVVQTNPKIVERCMLMTTDPGDLLLDPTCGSGTTAYVAEQWGRRWITIDTSRVALAIARQRLLTAKFDYYKLRDDTKGIAGSFRYKTVPHITLKSIAQNSNLDPIFAKHEPILDKQLVACNAALGKVGVEVRRKLELKLLDKQRAEGKRAVTDADRRRWELPAAPPPPANRLRKLPGAAPQTPGAPQTAAAQTPAAQHAAAIPHPAAYAAGSPGALGFLQWTVPFDTDPDWPKPLADAVTAYREAWRAKMDEVNACIAANAEQEELVDQPEIERGVVRVSGPFTVEAVQPPEMSLSDVAATIPMADEFGGAPEEIGPTFAAREVLVGDAPENVAAYLEQMIRLLRGDGVRFPDNKTMAFSRLEAVFASGQTNGFHAEGRWTPAGEPAASAAGSDDGPATVGVVVGPQYGPVTAKMIEDLIRPASRRYDDLVIAGFSFTAEAQALIDEKPHPKLRIHIAHIRPDVNPGMNGLLKEQPGSQLFTVFGQPRSHVDGPHDDEYTVVLEGVDIYNPVDNSITPTRADKVAAWFLDGDYDGKTFCITQAFFPDSSAWDKLSKALDGVVDPERFKSLAGTTSLPFRAGKHECAAVKVIDPRGNEVMRVHKLGEPAA